MSTSPHLTIIALAAIALPFLLILAIRALAEKAERDHRRRFLGGSAIPRHQMPLSLAEKRALIEVARGNSHKMAADNLGLTRRTVSNQISMVYLKKGANNITSAMARCLRDGDISLEDILQPPVDGAAGKPPTGHLLPHELPDGCPENKL